MRARFISAAVVAALCLALASVALAAQTTVTIKGPNGDFHGKVKSPKQGCVANRTVVVYKLLGNGYDPQNDTRIGSDTSDSSGAWSIGNSGFKHGTFYALAKKRGTCRRAFSDPLIL